MDKIIKNYLKYLEDADYNKLMSLFTDNAIINSPLYGQQNAKDFYKVLLEDTKESKLTLLNIFINEDKKSAAVHFKFNWILKDGTHAPFEVVDIIEFNKDITKISSLKIIYDTWHIRNDFDKVKKL